MNAYSFKQQVVNWSQQVGRAETVKKLGEEGIPPSTIDKLLAGRYPSEPAGLLRHTLTKLMVKDGVVLTNDTAS